MSRYVKLSHRSRWHRLRKRASRWIWYVPIGGAIAGLTAAAAFLAFGCAPAAVTASQAPALRLRLPADPPTLDPARAADGASVAVISQIFDGLVELDPATGDPAPALADSWEISPDGRTYTFHLRPDARFHDGSEVTAADVVFSFERVLSPRVRSERRWILARIQGAGPYWKGESPRVAGLRAAGRRTVEIELAAPYGPFLSMLALEAASIVPKEIYADPAEGYLRAPVGAGPFRFEAWTPGTEIRLTAHRDHHAGAPSVERVIYRVLDSDATAFEEYEAGGLDVLDEIPAGRRTGLASGRGAELRHHVQPALAFIGFNHARPPFKGNADLRRALNHAVDREYLCRVLQEGKDVPATGILPPGVAGHDVSASGYRYDPDLARSLLARAGHPGGKGLPTLTLGFNTSETHRRVCQKIQADLAAVGVEVALRQYDPGALMHAIEGDPERGSELDMFRMAWLADYPDPDAFMTPTLHSSSTPAMGNFGRYANPAFDDLLDRARASAVAAERIDLYRRAERLAVDDAAWLFLYFYGDDALVKPHVKNLVIPAFGELLAPLRLVSIERDPAPAASQAGVR